VTPKVFDAQKFRWYVFAKKGERFFFQAKRVRYMITENFDFLWEFIMKNVLAALIFLMFCSVFAFAQTPTPTPKQAETDDDVVKISTTLIQVDVTVTDRKGNIVTDLKTEDFEIYENGEKQQISNFSFISNQRIIETKNANEKVLVPVPQTEIRPEQVKRTIALIVDDLSLSFESVYYVRRALKKFVDEQMQPGDLVAIIRTGAGIGALQQFTTDKRQLYAAIEKVRWNATGTGNISAFAPIDGGGINSNQGNSENDSQQRKNPNAEFDNLRESYFVTGTLGALNYIIRGMQELPGRKSVMLMSEGFRLFTEDSSGFKEGSRILDNLRNLIDLANRASVVVYTMDARGLQTLGLTAADNVGELSAEQVSEQLSDRRAQLQDTQDGLIFLARQTGGLSIINNNDLSRGISRMLNDQSYYLIGYQPDADTFDAKNRRFNKLEIKVKRSDLKVRYRSGFFGVSDDKIAKQPTPQTPYQQITNALISPFAVNDISLRLNTLFGNDAAQGSYFRSLIHINAKDLKFTDAADGNKKAAFDVLAMSFGDNGTVVDRIAKSYTMQVKGEVYEKIMKDGFVYFFSFPVKKPGAYQLRVAIRDSQAQRVGSANQFIEVPNLKKDRVTISGIVLENFTRQQWQEISNDVSKTVESQSADSATNPMNDTSLRRFRRGSILRYGFEIYNVRLDAAKKPNLTTQIRIFRDGKLFLDGKKSPLDVTGQTDLERIKFTGAFGLGSEMTGGDYILQIVITDNLAKEKRQIATQFVQFELIE
jgi:VWFA-related protein